MLRPATPLTVLLFVAFILLLISVISTPVVKSIPLASFQGDDFGVFGYCRAVGGCSGIKVGYSISMPIIFYLKLSCDCNQHREWTIALATSIIR